jgi:hypothetical protein
MAVSTCWIRCNRERSGFEIPLCAGIQKPHARVSGPGQSSRFKVTLCGRTRSTEHAREYALCEILLWIP